MPDGLLSKSSAPDLLSARATGWAYVYDGDGERVEKCVVATSGTACPTTGTNGTLYWKGTGSEALDESDLSGNALEEYIFFNDQRIARRDVSTNVMHYYFSDHLGSHGVWSGAHRWRWYGCHERCIHGMTTPEALLITR